MIIKQIQDKKKRLFFFKLEILKKMFKILKILLLNNPKFKKFKSYIFYNLIKINKKINKISKVQINNRCIISNRNKGVYRHYSLSRIKMRELLQFGILPGYKKAAW